MTETDTDTPAIEVRASATHGLGAFAARTIQTGETLGRYAGRVYTPAQAARRNWDHAVTFVFALSDGCVIDGAQGGNAIRHLNHSCQPNCTAVEVEPETGRAWIEIEALRRVRAGEELFLDYQLDIGSGTAQDHVCRCGTRRCRGTMAGEVTGV